MHIDMAGVILPEVGKALVYQGFIGLLFERQRNRYEVADSVADFLPVIRETV